jgi:anti-anti-sigma factor
MATQPLTPRGLTLQFEEQNKQTIVHCTGRINAENSEMFQTEIRNVIPESGSQSEAISHRIVLDLSNVTHVDSSGLGPLLVGQTLYRSSNSLKQAAGRF